ncbi:MAG TPA: COX15/CtaA family protein [Acidimicrobiia bacterium]|nr:COX15/CtaA family protein [Acidimicrobiia bacterium]
MGGWLPRADFHMIVEWSHRWFAAAVGILAVATVVSAWRHHRHDRVVPFLATLALATIVFQAWIGRVVIQEQLDADLVSLHLAISLTAAALVMATVITARFDHVRAMRRDGMWISWLAGGAVFVFVVIMLGSVVHNMYFPGWPLMSGSLIPGFGSPEASLHFAHRVAAGLYAVIAVVLWVRARVRKRPSHEVAMLAVAAVLYLTNIVVGAGHVFTKVSSAALVSLHLGLAATVWVLTIGTMVSAARVGTTEAVGKPVGVRSSVF